VVRMIYRMVMHLSAAGMASVCVAGGELVSAPDNTPPAIWSDLSVSMRAGPSDRLVSLAEPKGL